VRIGLQPATGGPAADLALIERVAALADDLGFDSVQLPDHVVLPVDVASRYPYHPSGRFWANPDDDYFEPLSLLGYLAGRTRRVRLGTSVLVAPYREPVATGKQLACLDVLSGGRLVVGVGTGWLAEEFRVLGSPPFELRGRATEEVIEIFRRLWRDQPVSFDGEIYAFPAVGAMPKPLQPGGIPILLGGNSKRAVDRAVRLADGWQPFRLSPDELAPALALLRERAAAAERDLADFTVSLRLGLRVTSEEPDARPNEDGWNVLVGLPDRVADQIGAYGALGVDELVFDFRTCSPAETVESIEAAAATLLPFAQSL
jgi:probable F420-dependent oxidoreductase